MRSVIEVGFESVVSAFSVFTGQHASALDRSTIIHHADGRREVIMPDPPEVEIERERQRRAHAEAATAARQAQVEYDRKIAARVAAFLAAAGDVVPGVSAQSILIEHHRRIDQAKQMQAAAARRLAEVDHAAARYAGAKSSLAALETETATAFSAWIRFGSVGDPPAVPSAERDLLRREIADSEPLAKLNEEAAFESAVASAVVEALSDQLPDIRSRVLVEAANRSLTGSRRRSRHWKSTTALVITRRRGRPRIEPADRRPVRAAGAAR